MVTQTGIEPVISSLKGQRLCLFDYCAIKRSYLYCADPSVRKMSFIYRITHALCGTTFTGGSYPEALVGILMPPTPMSQ